MWVKKRMIKDPITIALSKGRILKETLPLLERMGLGVVESIEETRKLILTTQDPNVRLVVIRATDVPTYVRYGAADIGVAGKDVLMEQEGDGIYEVLDLKIAQCRLMVAGIENRQSRESRLRVATKYVRCAERFYAQQGKQVEIIKLYGSMELAPLMDLADEIVDLVDTGNTLRANGLAPLQHIADISSRLIVNKASMKVKFDTLHGLTEQFEEMVKAE